MISYSEYYEERLYPLQDGVLNSVEKCKAPFYLTGGTALSRGYYNHRYSDDLDFFVNNDPDFNDRVNDILRQLEKDGFYWSTEKDYFRTDDFCTLKAGKAGSDIFLKIDFVNDVAPHFDEVEEKPFFVRTDSLMNILTNKVTALLRLEGKDLADIREIARHYPFNWTDVIMKVREKEAGLELPVLAEVLKGIPREAFDVVKWTKAPAWDAFLGDMDVLARDMLTGGDNSLV